MNMKKSEATKLQKEKAVFFDLNDESLYLASRLFHENLSSEIAFVCDKSFTIFDSTKDYLKAIKADVYAAERMNLTKSEIAKLLSDDSRVFFLSSDSERNLNLCLAFMEAAKAAGVHTKNPLSLYLSCTAKDAEELLTAKCNELHMNFNTYVVKTPALIAHSLLNKFLPIDALKVNTENALVEEDFNLMLLGFGQIAREIFFNLYMTGRFSKSKFNAEIIDANASYNSKNIAKKFPGLVKDANLSFSEQDVNKSEFVLYLQKNILNKNVFAVALGSDELNVKTANLISGIASSLLKDKKITILCSIWNAKNAAGLLASTDTVTIIPFGTFDEIYTPDVLLGDKFEKSGKIVNEYYNSRKLDPYKMKNWNFMTTHDRDSNIYVAIFNRSFIKLIGEEKFAEFKTEEDFKSFMQSNPNLLENLARTEHRRWMAFLYAAGWDVLPLSDGLIANKDENLKLHTCLVPFSELAKVSELFNEDYIQYDKDNVMTIFELNKNLSQK